MKKGQHAAKCEVLAGALLSVKGHHNVLSALGVIDEGQHIAVVMRYCETDLLDYVLSVGAPLSRTVATELSFQLCCAVDHLHNVCNMAHGDIKLENIMLSGGVLKLADFGSSSMGISTPTSIITGSMYYMPHEVVSSHYLSCFADIWAVGVCMFGLAKGSFPFPVSERGCILSGLNSNAGWEGSLLLTRSSIREGLSEQLLDLLDNVFLFEPAHRIAASKMVQHSCFEPNRLRSLASHS
jgi:serine/threonine protein kinase